MAPCEEGATLLTWVRFLVVSKSPGSSSKMIFENILSGRHLNQRKSSLDLEYSFTDNHLQLLDIKMTITTLLFTTCCFLTF